MKTKVFKLDKLSKTDIQSIEQWLESLRWVWNEGLRMLEELDIFTTVYTEVVEGKKVFHRAACCPASVREPCRVGDDQSRCLDGFQ